MILGLFHSVIYVALITCFILTQLYNDKFSYGDEGVDEDQSPIDNQTVTEDQGIELEEKMKQAQGEAEKAKAKCYEKETKVSKKKEEEAYIGKPDEDETRDETKDKDGKDKNGKGKDDEGDDSKVVEHNKSVEGVFITEKHAADVNNCGGYTGYYRSESGGHIGKPGWFTKDLLKQFFPDLIGNKKIMDNIYTKDPTQYHAENFSITFKCEENTKCGSNINFTWGAPSNMWCNKGSEQGNAGLLCPKEFLSYKTSVCCPSTAPYYDYVYSRNFFLTDKCSNLILDLKGKELEECVGKTIVAKLESPLIILDYYNRIIDKDGNNTGIYYYYLKPYLNLDGTMKSCGNNVDCQKYAQIIDQILWTSDKEVRLKIPDNLEEKNSHFPGIQDEVLSSYSDNDLI